MKDWKVVVALLLNIFGGFVALFVPVFGVFIIAPSIALTCKRKSADEQHLFVLSIVVILSALLLFVFTLIKRFI